MRCQATSTLDGFRATGTQTAAKPAMSWVRIKRVVDRVHEHTCGHAKYSDINTLLVRDGLWTEAVNQYLTDIIARCPHYIATSALAVSRKVSLATLAREFNHTVCIDHFYLTELRLFHIMDTISRFSAVYITNTASMHEAIVGLQASSINHFWAPAHIRCDLAFANKKFRD